MFLLKKKLIKYIVGATSKTSIVAITTFALFHFLSSWSLMYYFEPNAEYVKLDTFYWFYVVSVTTIGYGDFYPSTLGARLTAALYMFPFGLIFAGYVIGIVANFFSNLINNRRSGVAKLNLKNHIIVFGEDDNRAEALIKNMVKDDSERDICLVSEHSSNPIHDVINNFVSGDILSADVREKCCLSEADTVIIFSQNDNQTVGEGLAALEYTKNDCRIILYFTEQESCDRFNKQSHSRVTCISSIDMGVLVQEALDEGSSSYISKLVKNGEGATITKMQIPMFTGVKAGYTPKYHEVASFLIRNGVTPLGLYHGNTIEMFPFHEMNIHSGWSLSVACSSRDALDSLDWSKI